MWRVPSNLDRDGYSGGMHPILGLILTFAILIGVAFALDQCNVGAGTVSEPGSTAPAPEGP